MGVTWCDSWQVCRPSRRRELCRDGSEHNGGQTTEEGVWSHGLLQRHVTAAADTLDSALAVALDQLPSHSVWPTEKPCAGCNKCVCNAST